MTQCRDYTLTTTSALSEVEAELLRAVNAWKSEWLGEDVTTSVRCSALDEEASLLFSGHWLHAHGKRLRVWLPEQSETQIGRQMLGAYPAGEGSVSHSVASGAIRELIHMLAGDAPSDRGNELLRVDGWSAEVGRQTMRVKVDLADLSLNILVQPLSARGQNTARTQGAPLGSLTVATKELPVSLQFRLGQATVDIGTVKDLTAGDVIRLDQRLDQPVAVMVNDQMLNCKAYLGEISGQLAVELTR